MSVDTRTPRTTVPPGNRNGEAARGPARGFAADEDVLSTVKVPCDPAQVVVNHASFRVRLPGPVPRNTAYDLARERAAWERSARERAVREGPRHEGTLHEAAARTAPRAARRQAPMVWSGRTGPEDTGAMRLLQAVRVPAAGFGAPGGPGAGSGGGGLDTVIGPDYGARSGGYAVGYPDEEATNASTQALPRIGGPDAPYIVGPRAPQPPDPPEPAWPLLTGIRPVGSAYDDPAAPRTHAPGSGTEPDYETGREADAEPAADPRSPYTTRRSGSVRHAYYPGRRMNLGVVLLPLRIFLGFISIYAGMGKLCDPVYFDGGERGSMVTWLRSLEPWAIASPLHEFALAHPVGAGLTVSFLQVIVGVLTIFGLWQRLAGSIGVLLSAALIMTVSWRTVPAYDAPDIIYLAAWSPLIIAGAPVYSVDARLAGEAWRRLGPRVEVADLRRRVLRRGAALATVVAGSALLLGALLGGAVRSSQTVTVPGTGEPPTNRLPGSALPEEPRESDGRGGRSPSAEPSGASSSPSPSASTSGPSGAASSAPGTPTQRQTVRAPQQPAPVRSADTAPAPAPTAGTTGEGTPSGGSTAGTSVGGGSGGDTGGAAGGGNGAARERSGGSDGEGGRGALGGLLG
ncbi:DoxX family protein [Streptomyces sp. N2-109]|uniref:DoxX family protein n=1 Tax=Streptomyces gossypii TaxID=2883101 RepID=A0ABT2JY17_9ACTN|nr:DoxX family protein [Streptomyces gossypii]MCT2592792.1 DoxX family protein [Streptomyces gossypii]